ncbi:N-acyl-phosphatidylethanolamine-hydrolyzing phospholipase D-like isoform X1 [Rhopilema esculentum]|uniref:N-acyl-phosphatidylethanolamine-hydrolyzing phospholipase D-like isoform X1 n=1 Tax=Rhopilema esculentum TaxID=499914 RepID=UPI0031D4FB27
MVHLFFIAQQQQPITVVCNAVYFKREGKVRYLLPVAIGYISGQKLLSSQNLMAESTAEIKEKLPKPLFINGRFQNSWGNPGRPGNWEALKFLTVYKNKTNLPSQKELDEMPDFVVHTPNYDMMTSAADDSLQVTWLGHASVLFQVDGMNILSDPVFGKFCGATQSRPFGQKRFRDCKTDVDNLPEIHAVVISHDHYDHLDYYTVKKLNKRFGDKLTWLVPLGTKKWMIDSGCSNVFELNWGDEHVLTTKSTEENGTSDNPGVKFVFAPAQHWCTRTLLDENTRLWGSWIIIGPKHRVYFAGDTGYCDIFKTIGNLYGPFDLAAIPIGAYRPRHVMINQHVDPEEAVKVHQDVKAKKSVAIHWGTFALAYENAREPPQLLRQCLEAANVKLEDFFLLQHGESRKIETDQDI